MLGPLRLTQPTATAYGMSQCRMGEAKRTHQKHIGSAALDPTYSYSLRHEMKNGFPEVSIVIPMYNAQGHIADVLKAVFAQDYPAPVEVIVVNDGSKDSSLEIVKTFQAGVMTPSISPPPSRGRAGWGLKILDQPNQGAAAATNNGFRTARHAIVCSVDSDVVLSRDWLKKAVKEFADPTVAAVQGYYKTPKGVSFWARMMGYDVEARYDAIPSKFVTHVCTGDTAYRKSALDEVGLFDAAFTYGYDNDMSYRLQNAGYKLVFRKDALCDHFWKADFTGYVRQQFNSAFGRLQLIRKHPARATGDSVSGLRMILQVPMTGLFFLLTLCSIIIFFVSPVSLFYPLRAALIVLGIILIDRLAFAADVFKKQRDISCFLLPFVHIIRNLVWCWAVLRWKAGT